MEAGLSIPEVVFEVGASLRQGGQFEMRERFAISSSASEAAAEEIGFESPDDCIFWLGNSASKLSIRRSLQMAFRWRAN